MMERYCGWGLVLLVVPLLGCGGSGNGDVSSSDNGTGNLDAQAETIPAPEPKQAESVPVRPTVDVAPEPRIPELPVELPKPSADEELRKRISQLYSAQIQQLVAEKKLAEADRLREDAIAYLRSQGPDVFDKLKGAMLDQSPEVRRGAAWYLFERVDRHDEQMVAVFVQALQDDDRTVRQLALAGIKSLPPPALAQFLPQLIALLERGREDDADRAAIAQLIGRLKTQAAPALEVLMRLGREDASSDVRLKCLYAASQIAADDQSVEMFRTALADPAVEVRRLAALRLGRLAPSAFVAVDDLAKALHDDAPTVREYAAVSLGRLGDGAAGAVDPLIAALDDPAPEVRRAAVAALSQLGPAAKRAIPALEKRLGDSDPKTQELARIAIDLLQSTP